MMNGSTRTLPARALPEGKIITQKYLDRSDVKEHMRLFNLVHLNLLLLILGQELLLDR